MRHNSLLYITLNYVVCVFFLNILALRDIYKKDTPSSLTRCPNAFYSTIFLACSQSGSICFSSWQVRKVSVACRS